MYSWLLLVCLVAVAVPLQGQASPVLSLGPITKIFIGKIRTMEAGADVDAAKKRAVGVDARGLIVAVGTEEEVVAAAKETAQLIRLASGQVLLPGFFDTHLHLDAMLTENSGLTALVGPCRPEPYKAGQSEDCRPYIQSALQNLEKNLARYGSFVVGNNLDPSRQPFNSTRSSDAFKALPAPDIGKYVSETTPILIIDQSGHFGYANYAAFRALESHLCKGKPPCEDFPPDLSGTEGGEWARRESCAATDASISCYTGLLVEPPAFYAFFGAIGASALNDLNEDLNKYVQGVGKGVLETLEGFRKSGVTTITTMSTTVDAVAATKTMAELEASGTRMVSIVPPEVARALLENKPKWIRPACDPTTDRACPKLRRDLGVSGIKILVDGSTQGCSAALQPPVSYQPGPCKPAEGRANYTGASEIVDELADLWRTRTWRFEAHANGNRALDMVLHAYESLQDEWPTPHTVTVVHATVGDDAIWKRAQELREKKGLDLRFSHLIGHVAYWGNVLDGQLGRKSAENTDPTVMDTLHGIPFSLHSDATVSVSNPLWFIRQAVTRETWKYPELTPVPPLGSNQRTSVLEALRAVTIRAAEEKELDEMLGSIKVGKVADFVVLSADPMDYEKDPTKISEIKVIDTYLGGERTKPAVASPRRVSPASASPKK